MATPNTAFRTRQNSTTNQAGFTQVLGCIGLSLLQFLISLSKEPQLEEKRLLWIDRPGGLMMLFAEWVSPVEKDV